jgi:serine/threonine protein kinase
LLNYEHKQALILEDIGGISLQDFNKKYQFSLEEFLTIAIQIAGTLEKLHEQNIIHKDIKPKNIIIGLTH